MQRLLQLVVIVLVVPLKVLVLSAKTTSTGDFVCLMENGLPTFGSTTAVLLLLLLLPGGRVEIRDRVRGIPNLQTTGLDDVVA